MKKIVATIVLALCIGGGLFAAAEDGTRRLGIFIGSNNGGADRITLRYAVSDARAVSKVFADMGGIEGGDNMLLVEPTVRDINSRIDAIQEQIVSSRQNNKRTEIVFYYSGHSDEAGLLLNRERYGYKELRERINQIPSDMRIVILDSCSSGSFARAKGGVKTQPFMIDSSLSAEGYAFLTSSSASEASQESDSIAGSYFTHSLVAGLRGAADTIGDGRVTLNEAYRFAYTETLLKTETSVFGAQHPSYDMQVSGTGDLVLTDIKETSASLVIDETISGRLSIRDSSDYLVAEITKTAGKTMELGLEPGLYRVTMQQGDRYFRTEVQLVQDRRTPLAQSAFVPIGAVPARARGDVDDGSSQSWNMFSLQLVPFGAPADTSNMLIGIIGSEGKNLQGIQMSSIYNVLNGNADGIQMAGVFNTIDGNLRGIQMGGVFNTVDGDVEGAQMAGVFNTIEGNLLGIQMGGVFNTVDGDVEGIQMAGIFNIAGKQFRGVQMAGIFNIAGEKFHGVQAGLYNQTGAGTESIFQLGLVNVSGNEAAVPVGLINVIKNGIMHPAIYYDDMEFINLSFRSGSKHFYSLMSVGTQRLNFGTLNGQELNIGKKDSDVLVYRAGIGAELPLGKRVFLDLDVSSGAIINFDTIRELETIFDEGFNEDIYEASIANLTQVRLTAGFKIFKHLGVFAGVSYDYLYRFNTDTSPDVNRSMGDFVYGWSDGKNVHKLGFFGGIQF